MMWLKVEPDGTPTVEGKTKPYCYHIDQFSELQPIIHRVMEYGKAMGLDMIQGDHEDAPGQLELNFMFDRAELTADRLTTYRQICRQVGREMDAFPCFMPKPFMGVSANGCHHNISLWQGEENMFLPDGDNPRMPGKIGLQAIGGVLEHLRALTCITAPTVNSYRRFWDAGFWAPIFADWGFQNRTTALRISAPGRFEYRSVDSAVNPYLSFAALLRHEGRHHPQASTPVPRRSATSTRPSRAASRSAGSRMTWARRSTRWRRTRSSSRPCRVRCTRSSGTTSGTSGSGSSPLSATGTSRVPRRPCAVAPARRSTDPHVRHRRHHPPGRATDIGSEMTRCCKR